MHDEIDQQVLQTAISDRSCVLFLGPDAYPFDEKQTVEQAMWAATARDEKLVRKFYEDDGLVLFLKPPYRGAFRKKMTAFYGNPAYDWSLVKLQLHKLIQIPFLSIVNLTFDDLLVQNFKDAGLSYESRHYIFRSSSDEMAIKELPLDKGKTLILNLLGTVHSSDNLVLTHEDMFDFLKIFFKNNDTWLKELLLKASCFLFIGVPFEKWYMQLILQQLWNDAKSGKKAELYALPEHKEIKMQDLYNHEFNILFVEASQQTVIDDMYKYCEDERILNKPAHDFRRYKKDAFQVVYRFLLRGDMKNALSGFLNWANGNAGLDKIGRIDADLLSSQFAALETNKDVLRFEDYKIELNRITRSLLYFLDENDGLL